MRELSAEQLQLLRGLWAAYNAAFDRLVDVITSYGTARDRAVPAAYKVSDVDRSRALGVQGVYDATRPRVIAAYVEVCGVQSQPIVEAYLDAMSPYPWIGLAPESELERTRANLDLLTGEPVTGH